MPTRPARIAEALRRPGPTVLEAIGEHIDLLTGVGADTRSHYRGQLASHIAPVLGALPVSAVTYRRAPARLSSGRFGLQNQPARGPCCTRLASVA